MNLLLSINKLFAGLCRNYFVLNVADITCICQHYEPRLLLRALQVNLFLGFQIDTRFGSLSSVPAFT